ncbi:MAG: RNA polymerase sigma factor [Eubacterium sp.]|nr:RNA polymerase sigma factor [Eubacterium sp.]
MDNEQLKSKFEDKYNQYGNMLYKIAFLYFGNSYDAEDALQEVFIRLMYDAPSFKDKNHEKAWLIRVTQNKCKDMLKASHYKNTSIDDVEISDFVKTENDAQLDVLKQVVALPAKYKTAIILYYYYDYSVPEISKTLQISNSAVKMRLKRGREILKIELEDYGNET